MMVIFSGEEPQLLLVNVVRGADGTVRKGDVVNGAWELEITPAGVMLAKTGETVVNSWPLYPGYRQVEVPRGWRGDYNQIMSRAAKELLG